MEKVDVIPKPQTIAELRASGYKLKSVGEELRDNLLRKLRSKEELFPGISGYDDTVVPQLVNAVLAQQSFILLGTRGQAKTRLLRALTNLLDEYIPVLAEADIPENPFSPITASGKAIVREHAESAKIRWVQRTERYVEKLATPDVTIADLIGDIDPIKAVREGHLLSDELVMQFGLLPRANRGIFAINELPDLAGKIQVGLFNIMEEGDIQIKGFPIRLPLDVFLVFSANPEDYTARGKIITPLKDRIGAEIRTHYPRTVEMGVSITKQESWVVRGTAPIVIPSVIHGIVEHIAFAARGDRRIDKRSGVSQRLPITVLELAVSNAERRSAINGEIVTNVRIIDIYAALPAITGKIELEYEGEQFGVDRIATDLIRKSCAQIFTEHFGQVELKPVLEFFKAKKSLELEDDASDDAALQCYRTVPSLIECASIGSVRTDTAGGLLVACELILEGLYGTKRLSRSEAFGGVSYAGAAPEGQKAMRVVNEEEWGGKLN